MEEFNFTKVEENKDTKEDFNFVPLSAEEAQNVIESSYHKYSANDVMSDKGLNVKPMSKLDTMLYDLEFWGREHYMRPVSDLATLGRTFTHTDVGVKQLGKEAVKSVARQANTMLVKNIAGFGIKNVGRILYDDKRSEDNVRVKMNHKIFGTMKDFGQSIQDWSDRINNSDLLKTDEKYFAGTFEQNPNLVRALDLTASGAVSVVGGYGLAKVVNPQTALFLMSGADCTDVFEESMEAGNGKLKSLGLWTLATAGTSKLEKVGLEKVFNVKITKKGMEAIVAGHKKTSAKILEGMLSEGLTEGAQTVWQNTVAKVGYDETRDLFQYALESVIGGALGGGLVSSFNYGIQAFNKRADANGLNEQQRQAILNVTAQTVADNPDLVDVPFQENMKKTYDSFTKMIEDMGDTPEAQRLIATKKALDEGYDRYYNQIKEFMPEAQAKANASLLRSSALFFSELEGISVDEWLKTRAPKIVRIGDVAQKAREFAENIVPTKVKLDENEVNLFEALKNPELVKQYRKKDRRKSLLQFIRKRGGVKDVGGDLKAMDLHKKWGIVNNKNGESLDDMALAAWEHGYFVGEERPTINDLLEAMRDESFGNKHYAEEKELDIDDYTLQLAEELDRMGIDWHNMSAREIEQAYNDYMKTTEQMPSSALSAPEDVDALFDLSEPFFQIAEENARLDEQYPAYEGETITINGQERTVYNSNGDRIAKSKEALENFYRWFGDSKVVDEQGRPLVVYHGTSAEFSVFDITKVGESTRNKGIFGYGFYSSNKEKIASSYRRTKGDLLPEGQGYIMPLYYKLENPFMWFQGGRFKEAKESIEIAKKLGFPKERIQDDGDGFIRLLPLTKDEQIEKFTQSLKDNGYDGVIFKYSGTDLFEYVAFNPNQIKSTSNRGTYSESENIYYQFAGERAKTAALNELNRAKQLEADGVDNEEIRQQTGWFKGVDGKWRFEISDKDADFNEGYNIDKWKENGTYFEGLNFKLGKILKHDKLFSAYPELKDVNIEFENRRTDDGTLGSFVKAENKIYLSNQLNSKKALSVIMHELQHVIQYKEGFASGGSLETKDVLEEKYKEIIEKYDYSPEMQALERDLDRYEFLYDIVNTLEVAENPQKIINKNWYKEKVFGTPKSKYRKSFIEEKAQQFIDEIKEKYLSKSSWYYSQYLEYVQDGKLKEIKKEMNALGKSTWRRMKKKKPSEYTDAKSFLWELENSGGYDIYRRLAGEIEARNTQARIELTEEERRAKTPESTQDVKNADAIVVFDDGTTMAYEPEVIQKFYQRGKADSYLGAYTNRIIYLNQNANESTLPHELAHFWSDELKQSKSLRAMELLKQADQWEEKEFERKYQVVKQGDRYIVADKAGKSVYDNQGNGFSTEEKAKAYAKEELFAQGFEQYLRSGGKAPSKTLKSAFANFYNWLKKLYVDMRNLDIKLSPNMRNLYSNILGGTSIDTFLDSDIDVFIEKRAEAEEDREKQTREIIQQAQQNKSKTFKEKAQQAYEAFDFGETWKEWAIPLSTRAKRISLSLRNKIRRYEYDTISTREKYLREVEPMLKKWKEFSDEDKVAFDLALKNNAPAIRDEILQKYNAVEDFNKVRDVLEQIYEQATNAGLDVGYIEDYFPRKVKDTQGLLSYLHGTDEWTGYQEALHREDPNNQFTAEEKADFLDKYLRGIVKADLAGYKYSSEKQRKLDVIDNTINQYYADSMQALINYIEGMNVRIQVANFFGRNRENVEESIGEFVAYMENNGEIKPEQVDEVKAILKGVFNRKGANAKWIKTLRDIGYIYTMGGINTAITQIDDIFVAAYKGGILNTIQSLTQKNRITKKDLGIESIAAEFLEGTGTSKAVNWVFKKNGIDFIDSMGKNILLNSVLKKMEKMSDTELREYIEPIMEDETEQTIQDIRNGNISDNVRFFLFNELSDMQPVSLSELPELYNTGRKARIFYMLKSFMLKRIDTIRNECYDNIRSKDKDRQIRGWQNLYKLALLMMLGGASKDLLIDLIYGRVIDLSDILVNNLLGMVGLSKYNIYQVREEGLGHSLALFVMPPLLQVAEDLSGDVDKYVKGKRELKDFEVLKGLPIIGRFYYWLFGGGKEKTEKKMKGGKKFRV